MLGTSFCKRVLENLSTAVLVVDAQLCVVYLNPSAEMLLAVSRSRIIGQPLAQVFIDCEGDGSLNKMAQTLKTAHPFTKREAHLRVNGLHEVTVDYTVSSLLTPQHPPELLIEIQPIDRLLRISREEAIVSNHQITKQLVRGVAHEIKNPLTPMKLSIQYLQKAINNNHENVKELSANVANTLVEQIDHLSKIAADFSQFANIGNTNAEQFDLHEVIASLKELYKPNPDVAIIWYPISDKAMVFADKTQMNRLFTNLFTNAVQATKAGEVCKITVDEKREQDKIIISIKDNGEGIPEEIRANIFVPNFTTKSSGTGLGLAMCKGIVEQAKGDIWFETQIGEGSVFYVSLPLLDDAV